jgi:serine protease
MLKRIFAVAAAASVALLGATAAAQAQPPARPAGHLHGVQVVNLHRAYLAHLGHTKPGRIADIVYPVGHSRPAAKTLAACTEPNCNLVYNGGPVQLDPRVYLLLWGPNWSSNPGEESSAAYLEKFYSGLGNSSDVWSPITSQYGDATGHPTFPYPVYKGAFLDNTVPPTGVTNTQIAAEADAFATTQGLTHLIDTQVVVATQAGTCPKGFAAPCNAKGRVYCSYHSKSQVPYVNLPYLLDAGTSCGEDFVNTDGTNDGWSIVAGQEYAGAITDPHPPQSWIDTADTVSGGEIGNKCGWGGSAWGSTDPITDMQLSTGSFAMQSLWSNSATGCVMSTLPLDTLALTAPPKQSSTVGKGASLQLAATSSAGRLVTYFAAGLPPGLTLDSHTGLITGTLAAAGSFSVRVAAEDETGALKTASFTWAVTGGGKPVVGDHGKCLDDSGSHTVPGNKVDIWNCNGTGAQQWTFSNGELSVLGLCLDDSTQGGAGAKLVIWTCNGHNAQIWTHKSDGEYVLKLNGLCLTDPSGSSQNGTQVVLHTCNAFSDQRWSGP